MRGHRSIGTGKRILLVFPRLSHTTNANDAVLPFPFLGLTQLAACIPDHRRLRLVDERLCPVSGREETDLVLITTLTANAQRAYDLSAAFRSRGIPVVLGGVHTSMLPDEAQGHADAIVIGEAEETLPRLLQDMEQGSLAPRYAPACMPDMDSLPPPALRLLTRRHRMFLSPIQTSRGCPNNCSFCAVPALSGRRLRLKSLASVERDLQALTRTGIRNLFVVDDNFTASRDRALALMDLFGHYRVRWMGFSTLGISEDEEFLAALARSGCVSLFIGFESLHNQGALAKNRGYLRPEAMQRAVRRIHGRGIGIQGSFIFGFDEDGPEVFEETVSFIQENGIELPSVNILTPFPGTPLFGSFTTEGRIIHRDWSLYDMSHAVFQPLGMSTEELQQGYAWALKYLSSPTSIVTRLRKGARSTGYFLIANFSLHFHQTRLARSLWDPAVQRSLEGRGLCRR